MIDEEIYIEKASHKEAKEIFEYLKQVGTETDNLTFGKEGPPVTIEQEAEYIAAMENSCDSVMFVAKHNGRIVGDVGLTRQPRRMKHRGNLGISVIKEYWNLGVGSMLMSKVIDFAKENQFEVIDLEVRCDNLGAIHLYEKFGFEKIGTHPAFFKIDGVEIPFYYMYYRIQ